LTRKTGLGGFTAAWTAAWLKPAAYRRRGWLAPKEGEPEATDYFTQLANMPDLPRDYRMRALAIVTHQQRLAALQRLLAAEATGA
jgi:hypothetical protein